MVKLTLIGWRCNASLTLLSWNNINAAAFARRLSKEILILLRNFILNRFRNSSQAKRVDPLDRIRSILISVDTSIKSYRVL